jgi:type II secretory pathway pseudopilin PulG
MFGAGAAIKAIVALVIVVVIAGGAWYVTGLRADLAVSEMNNAKLQEGIEAQQELMDQMRADIRQIQDINQDLKKETERQQAEFKALSNRFSQNARGEARDFGALAAERPEAIQRAVNRGTVNAMRCLEIASGAPLTEKELNARNSSEINRECPSIANPNYKPSTGN